MCVCVCGRVYVDVFTVISFVDATAQIAALTEELQREHSEKESLSSANEQLRKEVEELRTRTDQLEGAVKSRDEEVCTVWGPLVPSVMYSVVYSRVLWCPV